MASYFHGSAGTEIQAADGLQTLYLMNPNYVGYTDTSAAAAAAPANMVLLNSAMNTMTAAGSFGHTAPGQQHFVGIPVQQSQAAAAADPSRGVQYNLWGGASSSQAATSLPGQQQGGLSLSLSPREMAAPPPVTVAMTGSVVTELEGKVTPGRAHGVVMNSKYLKAAQMLLDEVVSLGKGSRLESNGKGTEFAARKKKTREESEEGSGAKSAGTEDGGGKNGGGGEELSTAERQELQMKKAKLVNMLNEVEQRYGQYHHQMQFVVSSFEEVAGPGSARTYTALALQTISKQFRCLRDAIAGQIRATSRSLGEDDTKTVGSRLRYIDHQLRQQRALQQLGMMQHNAWRPQRGLPERSVSILRAWLFEHFLHPYPKDSDKIMLAKQAGLTRSQVSNWFINARVRLWKPMVEEMYLEETKDHDQNSGDGENSSKNSSEKEPAIKSSTKAGQSKSSKSIQNNNNNNSNSMDPKRSSIILTTPELVDQQSQGSFFDDEATMQSKFKKARNDEPFHPTAMSESIGMQTRTEEVSNSELLLNFMKGSARVGGDQGYSLFTANANNGNSFGGAAYPMGEMGRFGSEQFAPRYGGNGVSLTLGLPHCEGLSLSGTQPSFLSNESTVMGRRLDMGSTEAGDYCGLNNGSNTAVAAHSANAYDMNMQNRKSFAAQLMRNFVS